MTRGQYEKTTLVHGTVVSLRYFLHLFPLFAAITVVVVNFIGIYIGASATWLPSLQFVAKLIEITMQTSIVAVVSSYLQHEVTNHAMAFGALFAALQITSPSYLWSSELWGGMTSSVMRQYRKTLFMFSVISSILLAAAVGPSFAIALIPRPENYAAGQASIWLDIMADYIFLTPLEGSVVPPNCSSATSLPFLGTECPSSEWPAIAELLSAYPGWTSARWNSLQTSNAIRNLLVDVTQEGTVNSVFATVPHAPVAEALQNVADLWWTAVTSIQSSIGSLGKFQTTSNYIHAMTALQPYAVVRCVKFQPTNASIPFPNRMPASDSGNGHWTNTSISPESVGQLIAGDNSFYKVNWVELPPQTFLNVSIGAIIVPPSSGSNHHSHPFSCSVYAGIGPASVNVTLSSGSIISSTMPTNSVNQFLWSLDRVNITTDWASSLIPPIDGLNITVDSAIYATMADVLDPDEQDPDHPGYFHEALLASLVVNGIARTGFSTKMIGFDATNDSFVLSDAVNNAWLSGSTHNIFQVDNSRSTGKYPLIVVSTVAGLAYSTDGISIKIALAVLILYCLVATLYVVYATFTKLSWCSWDTVAGLTVIALGSTQSQTCYQTSGHTVNIAIFREPVRISADSDGQLQLRLEVEDTDLN